MTRRPTIILVIIALLLAGIALIVSFRPSKPAPTFAPLLSIQPSDVQAITLTTPDGPGFRAERTVTAGVPGWMQTDPIEYPLRRMDVDNIILTLLALQPVESFVMPLEDFDLAPPLLTIAIPDQPSIHLGRRTMAGRAAVQLGDDPTIHIVDDALHAKLLDTDPVAWRLRRLFDNLSVDLSRINIEWTDGQAVRLARLSGRWHLTHPAGVPADRAAVGSLLAALIESNLHVFILDRPDDLSQFGLDAPIVTVTVETDRRRVDEKSEVRHTTDRQILLIGSPANVSGDTRFAKRAGRDVVVTVARSFVEAFAVPVTALVDPRALAAPATDVASIECSVGEASIMLRRTLDGWIVEGAQRDAVTDADKLAAATLAMLIDAPADQVIITGDEGADSTATVTVRDYRGADIGWYELSLRDDGATVLFDPVAGVTRIYARAFPMLDSLR
ncbi:MAG: DUF4340 domain-containing protein [Phycisphaerales bacterium]|nr:DUF4340 domain-containing protein [Phycisphaerales bacterium]